MESTDNYRLPDMHVMQKMSENEFQMDQYFFLSARKMCWPADLNSKQSNWTSNADF